MGIPPQYIAKFVEQEIRTQQDVLLLTEADMIEVLGLPVGIKNRILQLQGQFMQMHN